MDALAVWCSGGRCYTKYTFCAPHGGLCHTLYADADSTMPCTAVKGDTIVYGDLLRVEADRPSRKEAAKEYKRMRKLFSWCK